jgi:ABC-type branched-subunit amino acid transport system substrate-binding protein
MLLPLPAIPRRCYRVRVFEQAMRKLSDKSRHAWPSYMGGNSMKRALKDFIKTPCLRTLLRTIALSGLVMAAAALPAAAQKKYDTGVTDTEIKIGNIMPYSGPASAYGIIGETMSAHFRMINDNGGLNGRKMATIPN